ncbi:MAG: hypothetical protein OEW06_02980 [Gemmatimonadota bacterium]|nr:hypothetical protein [Gemmatimonadota bacterium]
MSETKARASRRAFCLGSFCKNGLTRRAVVCSVGAALGGAVAGAGDGEVTILGGAWAGVGAAGGDVTG